MRRFDFLHQSTNITLRQSHPFNPKEIIVQMFKMRPISSCIISSHDIPYSNHHQVIRDWSCCKSFLWSRHRLCSVNSLHFHLSPRASCWASSNKFILNQGLKAAYLNIDPSVDSLIIMFQGIDYYTFDNCFESSSAEYRLSTITDLSFPSRNADTGWFHSQTPI